MNAVHVFPLGDLIPHDTESDDCVCGPRSEPVARDDGSFGWVVVHHSLDGREGREVMRGRGKKGIIWPGTFRDRPLWVAADAQMVRLGNELGDDDDVLLVPTGETDPDFGYEIWRFDEAG